MKTIPLEPVFENALFQDAIPSVRFAVISAVYLICKQHRLNDDIPKYLEPYLGLCNSSYYKHKDIVRDILEQVMPKVRAIKRSKINQNVNGRKVMKDKRQELIVELNEPQLTDVVESNPAPLKPQLSSQSENIRRQSIINEQQFIRKPAKPSGNVKPMLTEKPVV